MLTLYSTPLSANGRKVLAACHYLGLDADVREVNVYRGEGQTPEYLAINPSGKIPFLKDADLALCESNAILQYLAEVHGNFALSARSAKERAEIASWLFWEAAHWQPELIRVLAPSVGHALLPESLPEPAEPPDWDDAALQTLLARLEAHLADRTHLVLGRLTIADFSVGGMATYFRKVGFPFESFPCFAAWYERLDSVDAWRATEAPLWKGD